MTEIENFIDAMVNKDYTKSNEMFTDLMNQKIDHALDAEKAAVASQVFGDEDLDDDYISDEELEYFADEELDDEDFEDDYEEDFEDEDV